MTVDAAAAGAAAGAAATADAQALAATSKAFYNLLAAFGLRTRRNAQAVWASLDANHLTASWGSQARDQLLVEVATAQLGAATAADRYVAAAVEAQGAVGQTGLVIPDAFAGVASDGGVLDDLLIQPMIQTIARLDAGVPSDQAMASGAATLDMIVGTQVADTGREATRTSMVAHRKVTGYVRMLTPPSCGRCAVLAGRFYRWSSGFQRHPQCDCVHVPSVEDTADDLRTDPKAYFDSLSAADQNRYFGAGNAEALRLGGDMSRVVNSSRGSRSKAAGLSTPGRRKGGKPTPGSLIAQAGGNRGEAIRLLTQHGFITN